MMYQFKKLGMNTIAFYIEILPFYLLFFWWLCMVFYKVTNLDREDNCIYNKAAEIKNPLISNFLTRLLDCELCMETHIGALTCSAWAVLCQDFIPLLFIPIGAGFNNIIKNLSA